MSGISIPIVLTSAGLQPQAPADLRAKIVSIAQGYSPGLTDDLPGSLIEDIVSTSVAAVSLCDQALVDLVNSLTPYGANEFLLGELGQIYGIPEGKTTNTSVYVVFSGPAGYPINPGFIVSDGTYQYTVQDGGAIGSSGSSAPLYAVATSEGSWAVPSGSVTQLVTSVPSVVTLSVTNPGNGTPAAESETPAEYQANVLQAGLCTCQGTPTFIKSLLSKIPGVQSRLISVQQSSDGWKIIVGGGDPYQIAGAIYQAMADISVLVASGIAARNITVSITDYPDVYQITFINPPPQNVSVNLTWNTISSNFVNPLTISQVGTPVIADYINSITVGQPINLFELQQVFQQAVKDIIPPQLLTRMVFSVTINGAVVNPNTGTGVIPGDSESYFITTEAQVIVTQG